MMYTKLAIICIGEVIGSNLSCHDSNCDVIYI